MTVLHEKCYVCGEVGDFEIADTGVLLREAVCSHCGSAVRHSDVAQAVSDCFSTGEPLAQAVSELEGLQILDTSPLGESYRLLSELSGCIGSEFFPDIPSGDKAENGMLCVDLTRIPFPDYTFDLVITEEILEHVSDLEQVFSEINRVLKPGGVHIFTIPVCETISTRSVSDLDVTHPAVSGGDSKVFHEFGLDIINTLRKFGFSTRYRVAHRFCPPEQTTNLRESYTEYCENKTSPLEFFQYNSIVFISEKISNTGHIAIERLDLSATNGLELVIEHLHRYQAVRELVEGKIVLDAACGSGYGTKLLAERAKRVVGIDIDPEVIKRLREEEPENISFHCMSVESMDFADDSFDAVVSFETIEHIDEAAQKRFLEEVKRVLKPDGFLVVSTPNVDVLKEVFTDYYNPFHVKEHTRDEFFALLKPCFKYVQEYYQNVVEASCISSTAESVPSNPIRAENGKYLIAVCSNCVMPANLLRGAYFPAADKYYHELRQSVTERAKLYIDSGFGFREEDAVTAECNYQKGCFRIVFDSSECRYIRALRFDPLEGAFCRVQINYCCVDGMLCPMEALNATERYETFDYFFHGDPQYSIEITNTRATRVEVEGYLDYRLSKKISLTYGRCKNHEIRIAEKDRELKEQKDQLQSLTLRVAEFYEAYATEARQREAEAKRAAEYREAYTTETRRREAEAKRAAEFQAAYTTEARQREAEAKRAAEYREAYATEARQREAEAKRAAELQEAYNIIVNSYFWKMTKPFRVIVDRVKNLFEKKQ